MYSSQTSSLATHPRIPQASTPLFPASRASEHAPPSDRKPSDEQGAHVFTVAHHSPLPASSSERHPHRHRARHEKEKCVTPTPERRRASVVSPSQSLDSPQSLFSNPSLPPSMSTLQASSGKNLENGSNSGADDEGKQLRESHKKRSKNWTRPESLHLIRLRTHLEPRFAKSGRKTELWDEIAEALHRESFTRDAQQCRDKWEKLTAGYKEVRDGVKEREDNPFYDELHSLLSGKSIKRERDKEPGLDTAMDEDKPHIQPQTQAQAQAQTQTQTEPSHQALEDDHDDGYEEPARKRTKVMSVTDVEAVQSVLETVITRQQSFFRELLDAMERKEQMREQMRQEKEDKWRAEERAQRGVFNNAMIVLTQKLVGEQIGASLAMAGVNPPPAPAIPAPVPVPAAPVVGSPEGHQGAPKRRSKNWKRAEVLQLIRLRGEMDTRFAHSTRRAALWDELAERLLVQGIKRDGKQCREKWDKLMAEYKDVTDGKRDQRESPYYSELTAILGRPSDAP